MLEARLRKIRAALDDVCADVGKEFNLEFKLGNITYHDNGGSLKLEFAEKDEDGNILSKDALMFKECSYRYGIPSDMLFSNFVCNGEDFKIIGLNRRKKKCIQCKRDDGRMYNFAPAHILELT